MALPRADLTHMANKSDITTMQNGHMDPKVLQISTKVQPTATVTSHIIAKYVPETNISLKYHIC